MTIQFLGAAGEVTGSSYFIEDGDTRFLIDCGMFQGSDEAIEKNKARWPFEPSSLDFVLLTHAHFDHCGRLPKLYHDGFRGHIYTTAQTAELADLILADAADLMFHEAKTHHDIPLYTLNEVKALNSMYRPVPYKTSTRISDKVSVIFHDAGHILGSAIIEVIINGKHIIFSGDLGNDPVPLMNPPAQPESADVVVVESTYGDRLHEHSDRVAELKKAVLDVVANKGTLLIPAFALERTQELLYHFNDLRETGAIPDIPIFVDSPLAIETTAVFRRYESLFDSDSQKHIQHGDDFFSFPHLKYCTTVEESKSINFVAAPKIIIAGSGMMNGGRISHHLIHYGGIKSTIICIVGFMVQHSLGRRILDGERQIHVMHQDMTLEAEVRQISAFSAHADQAQLLEWISGYKKIGQLYVTHGEETSREVLVGKIKQAHPDLRVEMPELLQSVNIE
ncbi:MAG: MBL fold metallo-hydrolase [Patescibacteria group bacterium]|jgi:metallo-beta-lactamase family protein